MHHYFLRLSFFVLLFVTSGCFNKPQKITKQEATDFANNLTASIAERNPNVFNNVFDAEAIKDKIMAASNNKLSAIDLSQIPESLKKRRIGDDIIASVSDGGMYQTIKTYEINGKQHVIFRLYGSSGLNYHDMELVRSGKEIKAADMYIYLTGESLSKTLADFMLQTGKYFDSNLSSINAVNDIRKYMKLEEYNKALSALEQLPDTLRKQKLFQIIHVQITAQLENDVYVKALDEYEKLYPNEPGMYITSLETHFSHEEYNDALNDVNKMDSLINKDPFLDYYRGLIYKVQKDTTKEQVCFENLYKNMPGFGKGIVELMALYARDGETKKANALVKAYKANKKLNQEDLKFMLLKYPDLEK